MEIILSGGDLGGTTVEWESGTLVGSESSLEVRDFNGKLYRATTDKSQAVYIGSAPYATPSNT